MAVPSVDRVIRGRLRSWAALLAADDASGDISGPEPQPQIAFALRPRLDRQRLHSLHVLDVVPAHLLEVSSDQNAPPRLRLAVEAVDLECRMTLPHIESRAGHGADHDV